MVAVAVQGTICKSSTKFSKKEKLSSKYYKREFLYRIKGIKALIPCALLSGNKGRQAAIRTLRI